MHFNFKEIFTVFMVLFAVIDVVGNIPIVISLRQKSGHIQSEKASIIAGIIMILFLPYFQTGKKISSLSNIEVRFLQYGPASLFLLVLLCTLVYSCRL